MKQETSQWGKAVKKAVIDHDMTLKQLAEKIGYSNATVSQVVNGRYSNSSYKVIAEKINEVLSRGRLGRVCYPDKPKSEDKSA